MAAPKIDDVSKAEGTTQPVLIPAGMSENEQKVWQTLSPDEQVHIDVLLETTRLSFGDLNTALVGLDIRDLIRVLPGKHYARRI